MGFLGRRVAFAFYGVRSFRVGRTELAEDLAFRAAAQLAETGGDTPRQAWKAWRIVAEDWLLESGKVVEKPTMCYPIPSAGSAHNQVAATMAAKMLSCLRSRPSRARMTLFCVLPGSLTMIWRRVMRSVSTSRQKGDPPAHPTTVSISQWPYSRRPSASGGDGAVTINSSVYPVA